MQKVHLVVIDPQNSFCNIVQAGDQQKLHDGELCVAGAWDDMQRVANLVKRLGRKLSQIHVTLDSHHQWHIAHPCWFKDGKGNHPAPFTMMRNENNNIIGAQFDANGQPHDVGEYTPTLFGDAYKWTYKYLAELSTGGRYPHVIWPYHCLIGTPGHNIVAPLNEAIFEWEQNVRQTVNKITKGSCRFVEHFSAVRAEVAYSEDPSTQLNTDFVTMLGHDADEVLIAGEALSHCVANTFRDIATELGDDFVKKCVLLQDASSNVTGFEVYGEQFVKDMVARGMRVTTTVDYLK
jgi:nicotinamidase/pyrazinamidase